MLVLSRKSGLNVLLVEDDPDTQANLCEILELDGHHVAIAGTAKAALDQRDWMGLSAIILDRHLPDGSAEELLPELKQLAPHADVIVVTGYADLDGTITALRQGAADYILKPINADALRASLGRIAQRRQMQHSLHEERQFAERVLQSAEAIVLVLNLDGNVELFNLYTQELTGWQLDEVKGEDWFDIFLPEHDHVRVKDAFQRTIDGVQTTGTISPIVTKDGCKRDIRWANTTLADEQGQVTAVLAVGLDVTDHLDAQKHMLQSERLAAIGQTVTALAHESRNALQRIQVGVELLEFELGEGHVGLGDLKLIETASDDLRGLLEEVRAYAAPMQLDRYESNVASVWWRAWEHLAVARQDRDATINEQLGELNVQIAVDAGRLEQVFRNLFENSLAAASDPVQIDIACSATRLADQDAIQISIRDNGPGLTKDQRQKVFDAFYTTKSRGTGIGMAIVKRIVESHGGQIAVGDSSSGAEFIITLPRTAE